MKTTFGGAVTLVMMIALPAADLAAQQNRAGRGPRTRAVVVDRSGHIGGAPGIEAVLRMRDRLELSEEQVARLDALRSEVVERRTQEIAESREVRSRLLAGTIERTEAIDRLRDIREARAARIGHHREALESLLDERQRATLKELRAERRAFEAGRRFGMRERARGPRGRGGAWRNAPTRGLRPSP